jgi:outer membrane immunogenic protein
MKSLSLAIVALGAIVTTSAMAADMAPHMAVKAPPPTPVFSWTGFYIGGNFGYGWGSANNSNNSSSPCPVCLVAPLPDFATLSANEANGVNGVIGGAQVGYNWQITNYLFGIEADFQGSGQNGTNTSASAFFLPIAFFGGASTPSSTTVANTTKLEWFGTARGRVGYVVDNWLVYATGGLAYADIKVSGVVNPATIVALAPNVPFTVGDSATKTGWVVGAGVESALSTNWSWKIEYLYMDFGNVTATGTVPAQGCLGNALACNPTSAGSSRFNTEFTDSIVRVGLNYRFH